MPADGRSLNRGNPGGDNLKAVGQIRQNFGRKGCFIKRGIRILGAEADVTALQEFYVIFTAQQSVIGNCAPADGGNPVNQSGYLFGLLFGTKSENMHMILLR